MRFIVFSSIGGFVFVLGLALQVALTGSLRLPAMGSYLIQAVVSVETSFLLNRWITWRDRDTPFWTSFVRFNIQKAVTVALNVALYAVLLRIGMNYLIANVVLTAVFTAVNYVAGDRLVFITNKAQTAEPEVPPAPGIAGRRKTPQVSVVIPCRGNQSTIGDAVQSLLAQDYPGLQEVILIGSPDDPTWQGLQGVVDSRLALFELETPPGLRDANFKRDAGIRMTGSDLVALVDSDIVLPSNWMSLAVSALEANGASCVTGGMKSIHDTFWGRYTDSTWIGAKTPRVAKSYTVTSENFGAGNRKPPITANTLFTRKLYEDCPIDPSWSHGSYEDYEWFWRVARAGYAIVVSTDLFGWHHHRRGLRALAKEYRRSSRGCAYFIRAHLDSPLARRRLRQAITLPLAGLATLVAAAAATASGHGEAVAAAAITCAALLIVRQVTRSRRFESAAYPVLGAALGIVFATGLITNLIRSSAPTAPAAPNLRPSEAAHSWPRRRNESKTPRRRQLLHPLTAILVLQSALSFSMIWSNTAFNDEADYLWIGHQLIGHWLHGSSWPAFYGESTLSGSPFLYPPLGALADSAGSLAGARILSMLFMMGATVCLWLVARRLFCSSAATAACALWVVSEPTIKLGAFATYDAMSVFLLALSVLIVIQVGSRARRGELVVAAAVALGLSAATAYSGLLMLPFVIIFAFLALKSELGTRQSAYCSAWFGAVSAIAFLGLIEVSHSWGGLLFTVVNRQVGGAKASAFHVIHDTWSYTGLTLVLGAVGTVVALSAVEKPRRRLLVASLLVAGVAVPIAQSHDQTVVSLDKHLAYGIWFTAIAAGYGLSRLVQLMPRMRRMSIAAAVCSVAIAYPAINGWDAAWHDFHSWGNATSFVNALRSTLGTTQGAIYVPNGSMFVATYYTPQGVSWRRWASGFSQPFEQTVKSGKYGVIVLFYTTSISSPSLNGKLLLSTPPSGLHGELLNLVSANSRTPGLASLTADLQTDPAYRLMAIGPYGNDTGDVIYSIWKRVAR